jgi:rhamnosyl/mannosyltransferase
VKILQFGKYYYPTFGGMEHVIYEITEGLNSIDIKCDVLCSNTKPIYEEDKFSNYTVYRTASYAVVKSTSITPQLIYKLWKMYKNYDVIHVHHPDPMAFLALFLIRPKSKVVIHWHSDIIRQRKILKYFLPLQKWVLNYADKIISTSESYTKYSVYLQEFEEKVVNIPIGISDKNYIYNENNVKKIHEKYKNKKIIFALGRLVSYKGFIYLAESAKYLNDDFIILIAGIGVEKENILEYIDLHNLQDKVKLLGYLDEQEKYDHFQACFFFCLPSITKAEAFGVVLLEAMIFSKPIISSNIVESGLSWVNEDKTSGLQVKMKSAKELAKAFIALEEDNKLYLNLCKNSYKRYEDLFTRERMIKSLKKVYESIL